MKKLILLTILSMWGVLAFGQSQIDTNKKVKLSQADIWNIHQYLTQAKEKIHRLDIPALKRDSLDNILIGITVFIEQKYVKAVPEKQPVKKEEPKK